MIVRAKTWQKPNVVKSMKCSRHLHSLVQCSFVEAQIVAFDEARVDPQREHLHTQEQLPVEKKQQQKATSVREARRLQYSCYRKPALQVHPGEQNSTAPVNSIKHTQHSR